MAHNGGKFQTHPSTFLSSIYTTGTNGCWPFMNKVKTCGPWALSSGRPDIANLSANGYPTSATGSPNIVIDDEGNTYRPGIGTSKRILAWDGTATFTLSGATLSSGSLSGTNGRAVLTLSTSTSPKKVTITLTATDGTLDNMRWLHEDDESAYIAAKIANANLEPFNPPFIQKMQALKPGVLRFLDWQFGNEGNIFSWVHRTPTTHFSFAASQFRGVSATGRPSLYGGFLGGTSPTFTATLAGFTLTDGATVQVDILSTTAASGTPTLNVSSTGAKPIKIPGGSAWSLSTSSVNRRATFVYILQLDCFICTTGANISPNITSFDEGLISGVPPEVVIDLCNQIGCHAHVVPPFLACDSPSDYVSSFAAYAAANLNSGLMFRIEGGPNECWNPQFYGTSHGTASALSRYGTGILDDWYGRTCSLIGQAVSAAFGNDKTRYAVLCGFSVTGTPDGVNGANTTRRLESTRYISMDGGTVHAKDVATHVCVNNYWTTMNAFAGTIGTTAEQYLRMVNFVALSRDWSNGDTNAKRVKIDAVFDSTALETWMTQGLDVRFAVWKAVANNYNLVLTMYEGNYYPGDIAVDPTHGIDGVTQGYPTKILINNINSQQAHAFQSGMTCRFRGLSGSAQLLPSTITMTIASPAVITFTNGGLKPNTKFTLSVSGGSLPTGVTAGTTYYVKNAIDNNTFTFSTTPGGTEIISSGTQSGTITITVTYNVTTSDSTSVTIDVDSTNFSAFTSGGSGTFTYSSLGTGIIYDGYGNTGAKILPSFELASRYSALAYNGTRKAYLRCKANSVDFLSDFFYVGTQQQWAKGDDFYSTLSSQVDALLHANAGKRRIFW